MTFVRKCICINLFCIQIQESTEPEASGGEKAAPETEDDEGTPKRRLQAKVVVVGDGAVGKTCLCHVFVHKEFPATYVPTVFENHTSEVKLQDGTTVIDHTGITQP